MSAEIRQLMCDSRKHIFQRYGFQMKRHMARILPQPPVEGEEHVHPDDLPDFDDLPAFDEIDAAEGAERMGGTSRKYETFLEMPRSIAEGSGKESDEVVAIDW